MRWTEKDAVVDFVAMRQVAARLWLGAVLSGVLQVLSFPIAGPVPAWRSQLCWVSLLPLLWALLGQRRDGRGIGVWQGVALGYVCGFCWYLGNCYWIYQTMYLYGGLAKPVAAGILVLFCLYLGLYHALFGGLVAAVRGSRLGRQGALVVAPFAWVAVELARARITGFPWDLLGVAQVDNPVLTRLAPWTGVYGISFAIAAVNALWLLRVEVRRRRWTRPALAAGGAVLVAGYLGLTVWARRGAVERGELGQATLLQENLEVGAVADGRSAESEASLLEQFTGWSLNPNGEVLGGVPEAPGTRVVRAAGTGERRGLEALDELRQTQTGEGQGGGRATVLPVTHTDVMVWPESPAPFEEGNPGFREEISELARTAVEPVIVGNIGVDRTSDPQNLRGYELYNSASFVSATGAFLGRYDKMHLVPFGEYVPFKRLFFFAGHLLAEVGTFEPGRVRRLMVTGGHRYGVFICYESIFGDEVREFADAGAEVLVNLSNDGWYGDTSAPWQHLNMVRMRAIENHRWVLRATNTGVTASIDPLGRVVAAAPRHLRTAIRVPFFYEQGRTFYVRWGDWFAWGCAAVTAGALGWGRWDERERRSGKRLA